MSADGTRLYASDPAGGQVAIFDLGARTLIGSWSASAVYDRIVWARIDGLAALLSTSSRIYVPESGAVLGTLPWIGASSATLTVSRDGTRVCGGDLGMNPYYTRCATLASGVGAFGPAVRVGSTQSRWNTFGADPSLALGADGTRLYQAGGALQLAAIDATAATLGSVTFAGPTTTFLLAAAVGPDGRVYAGGWPDTGSESLWAWDAAGNLLWSRDVGTIVRGRLAVTGDGLRLLALTAANGYSPANALKAVTLP